MYHLDNTYGGMAHKLPKSKPIITFKDIQIGLKAESVKNIIQARKGEVVEVTRVDKDKVYFKSRLGEQSLTQIEFCLYFARLDLI